MGWFSNLFSPEPDKDNQLHRRVQRAESDAIHLMRLNQNLEMRLGYAVAKVKELKEDNESLRFLLKLERKEQ